jgi:hypothetical protein
MNTVQQVKGPVQFFGRRRTEPIFNFSLRRTALQFLSGGLLLRPRQTEGVPSVSWRGAGRDPQAARGSSQDSLPKGHDILPLLATHPFNSWSRLAARCAAQIWHPHCSRGTAFLTIERESSERLFNSSAGGSLAKR